MDSTDLNPIENKSGA